LPDPALNIAATKLADQARDNPFFEFLARGQTQRMRDLILEECIYDPASNQPRFFQWSWERPVVKDASPETMLWDCIFIVDLLQKGLVPFKTKVPGDPSGLMPSISALWEDVKQAAGELEEVIKAILDVKGALADAADTLSQQLKYLQKVAEAVARGALPRVNDDGSVTLAPPAPGNPSVTVDPRRGHVEISVGGHCFIC
jgi:hypothetical protein